MKNIIIHLFGFPGTGKYTIAKEICTQADVKLVDNHLINNPLFSLIEKDGITPLPDRIWDNIGKIWDVVADTITHISPQNYNFIITNALINEGKTDRGWMEKMSDVASARDGHYIPVRLTLSVEENQKRIISPDRAVRMKEINPKSPQNNAANYSVLSTAHKNELTLDVTNLPAEEAARIIINHARDCEQNSD